MNESYCNKVVACIYPAVNMNPTFRSLHHANMPAVVSPIPLTDVHIQDIPNRTQVLMDVEFLSRFTSMERPTICVYPTAPSQSHTDFIAKLFPHIEFFVFDANMGQDLNPFLDIEYDPENPKMFESPATFVNEHGILADTRGFRKFQNLTITSLSLTTRDAVRFKQRNTDQKDLVMISRHYDISKQMDLHKLTGADWSFFAVSLAQVNRLYRGDLVIPLYTHANNSFVYQVVHREAPLEFYNFALMRAELSFVHSSMRATPKYDHDAETLIVYCYTQKFGYVQAEDLFNGLSLV